MKNNQTKLLCAGTLAAMMFIAASGPSRGATFDFTKAELIDRLNVALKTDAAQGVQADKVKACRRQDGATLCDFTDNAFQFTIKRFKEMNLANGNFHQDLHMTIQEDGGKVSKIGVIGNRADPVNLLYFGGFMADLFMAIKPDLTNEEAVKVSLALGIERGDKDPSIGSPVNQIEDWAAMKCLNSPSEKTMAILCTIDPRF
jgi:hypothetical protein